MHFTAISFFSFFSLQCIHADRAVHFSVSWLSNFLSINIFRGFRIMLAKRQRARQQFYKHSKWKRLTQVEIENRLFPCMFNSKGDNLGQRQIQIEFETVWCFMIKWRSGFTHKHLHKTWCSAECHLPSTKRVLMENTDFQLMAIIPSWVIAKKS